MIRGGHNDYFGRTRPAHALMLAGTLLLAACSPANVTDSGTDAGLDAGIDTPDVESIDAAPETTPDVASPRDPLSWPVMQAGPFQVGYRTFPITYTPEGGTATRTITINVWYPTLHPNTHWPRYFNIFLDRQVSTDAPLAEPVYPRGFPVHVYSHGHQGFGATSYFLMKYFASHGWVAIAPDHLGNTLMDTPDPLPPAIQYLRAQDIRQTLDALEHLPATDPLAGHCDTARVIMSGHSFGTQTVWTNSGATFDLDAIHANCATCTPADFTAFANSYLDPRVVVSIPMAGAINRNFFGPNGHSSVHIPMLAMSGTADPVGDDVQFMTTTGVDLSWIEVTGACHQFFGLGACTDIPDTLQPVIVGTYALAYARKYVLGDTDPTVLGVVDGSIPVSDRVTYHRR